MKKNLAKVLGMEEYPIIEGNQTHIQELNTLNVEQDMDNFNYAASEALEAISNAYELGTVIAMNNSQDTTTYNVLKVAVEQLKKRTGVVSRSVCFEDMNKLNYRAEALQDVKAFIVKTWEAIKKALAVVWEKIKAFFASIFNRSKEQKKEVEELKKEIKDLPKSVVGVVDEKFTIYSDSVYKYIGIPANGSSDPSNVIRLMDAHLDTVAELILNADDQSRTAWRDIGSIDQSGKITIPEVDLSDKSIDKGKFKLGVYKYELKISDGLLLTEILQDDSVSKFKPFTIPSQNLLKMLLESMTADIDNILKYGNIVEYFYKETKLDVEKREAILTSKSSDYMVENKDSINKLRNNFNAALKFNKSAMSSGAKLNLFKQKTIDAGIQYVKQSIAYSDNHTDADKGDDTSVNKKSLSQAESKMSKVNSKN